MWLHLSLVLGRVAAVHSAEAVLELPQLARAPRLSVTDRAAVEQPREPRQRGPAALVLPA